MATVQLRSRRAERGLTLIEALVVVTITAVLALLLLPLVSRAAGRNFGIATHSLDAVQFGLAETQVRDLLSAAIQQPEDSVSIEGQAQSVAFVPSLSTPVACAQAGASYWVRLRIERLGEGGHLMCETRVGNQEMFAWSRGEGTFAYSADGGAWSRSWSETPPRPGASVVATRRAPLLRFELNMPDAPPVVWQARIGSTETVELRAESAS